MQGSLYDVDCPCGNFRKANSALNHCGAFFYQAQQLHRLKYTRKGLIRITGDMFFIMRSSVFTTGLCFFLLVNNDAEKPQPDSYPAGNEILQLHKNLPFKWYNSGL